MKTHIPQRWTAITNPGDKITAENWVFHAPCGQSGNSRWPTWDMEPTCKACIKWVQKGGIASGPPREVTEKLIDDFEKNKRVEKYVGNFEEHRHLGAVKSMLRLYTCQRSAMVIGDKSCAQLPGAPTLCALCYLCQCLDLKVPTPLDLLKYAREDR